MSGFFALKVPKVPQNATISGALSGRMAARRQAQESLKVTKVTVNATIFVTLGDLAKVPGALRQAKSRTSQIS
jgi:hypothetical protein